MWLFGAKKHRRLVEWKPKFENNEWYVRGGAEPTHKGNCKFCAERDSIKWEKRKAELIKELKNE